MINSSKDSSKTIESYTYKNSVDNIPWVVYDVIKK